MTQSNLKELIDRQECQLFKVAERLVPKVTKEDLLQPFDHQELIQDPQFCYEEGVWHGLMMAEAFLKNLP